MKISLIAFNKPFGAIRQSSSHDKQTTLKDYIEAGFYAVGYWNTNSLLLTNNSHPRAKITELKFKLARSYLVQVDGDITDKVIHRISFSVQLEEFKTAPLRYLKGRYRKNCVSAFL